MNNEIKMAKAMDIIEKETRANQLLKGMITNTACTIEAYEEYSSLVSEINKYYLAKSNEVIKLQSAADSLALKFIGWAK